VKSKYALSVLVGTAGMAFRNDFQAYFHRIAHHKQLANYKRSVGLYRCSAVHFLQRNYDYGFFIKNI
jgi:hypothetical protein